MFKLRKNNKSKAVNLLEAKPREEYKPPQTKASRRQQSQSVPKASQSGGQAAGQAHLGGQATGKSAPAPVEKAEPPKSVPAKPVEKKPVSPKNDHRRLLIILLIILSIFSFAAWLILKNRQVPVGEIAQDMSGQKPEEVVPVELPSHLISGEVVEIDCRKRLITVFYNGTSSVHEYSPDDLFQQLVPSEGDGGNAPFTFERIEPDQVEIGDRISTSIVEQGQVRKWTVDL